VLQQRTDLNPTATHASGATNFATIMGDASWVDYEVDISARLLGNTALGSSSEGSGGRFLYVASHTGVIQNGSSCVLSGNPLPQV
jgi:hypothetical protein